MANPYEVNGVKFKVKDGISTCLEPILLDIETYNNKSDDTNKLETHMTSCQILFGDEYHLFRTPEEVVDFFLSLYKRYRLYPSKDLKKRMIIYVHNLSYDITYLLPYFERYLPDFGLGSFGIIPKMNKFITYVRGSFEFRDSYVLSGSSLDKWSKDMQIAHPKKTGTYDYDKEHFQDDDLDETEQEYDKTDVVALQECIYKTLEVYGDDLSTIPLTKTGYIRRELRRSCVNDKEYRQKYFKAMQVDTETYKALRAAYAGGYTHNNMYKRDTLVTGLIGHRDFKSHYPTQMTCGKFPGKLEKIYDINMCEYPMTIDEVLSYTPEFATLVTIRIFEAKRKSKEITMPFLAVCHGENDLDGNTTILPDNGRILTMKAETGMVYNFTEYDLMIINDQYHLEYQIEKVWRAPVLYLPKCITNVIDNAFKGKSEKKALLKQCEDAYGENDPRTREAAFDCQLFKATVNGIYGCCATDPLRDCYEVRPDDLSLVLKQCYTTDDEITDGLTDFFKKRNNFLPYQWGVWVTAMARYELYEYITTIGYDKCLYSDTDSIFYIKDEDTEKRIEALNAEKRKTAHYVTLDNGKREYYDEFTPELDCLAFKGLHAKCYGVVNKEYINKKGEQMPPELKLTIAGVKASTTWMENGVSYRMTREDELADGEKDLFKALDKLTFGSEFRRNAGTTAVYIGAQGMGSAREPMQLVVKDKNGNEHIVSTAGGCVIRKTEKKVIRKMPFEEEYSEDILGLNTEE